MPQSTRKQTTSGNRPLAIDLFSGCGGLSFGLRLAGFDVIGAVEKDPLAADTYRMNHRDATLWEADIRDLTVSAVKRHLGLRRGALDLLAGCPPCQGFSSMRTLNGARQITDERNDLVFEFLRFVRHLRPRAIMLENVPGLASDQRMARIGRELKSLGYSFDCAVLDAADYGVPQRRRRMILLGGRSGRVGFAPSDPHRSTVRGAIGFLPLPEHSTDTLHRSYASHTSRIQALIVKIPKNGGSRADLGLDEQLPCHQRCDGFRDVYGRMWWDDVAPTITSGCVNPSKGRFLHPEQDRAITLREASLLQTFPPTYYFPLERGVYPTASLIGNALPPEFVRRHACRVRDYLRISEETKLTAEEHRESDD